MYFNFFLLQSFADISQLQEVFPFLAKLMVQKILIVLAIMGALASREAQQSLREKISGSFQVKAFIFIVVWMLLSVPFSVYPGNSVRFLTETFWKSAVIFFLLLAYGSSLRNFDRIIWAYILGIGLMGLLGALRADPAARLTVAQSIDANELAMTLVVFFPFIFWKSVLSTGIKRLIPLVFCVLIIFSIIKTGSRGGFLGLAAVFAVLLMQLRSHEKKYFRAGLAAAVLSAAALFMLSDSQFWERMSTLLNYRQDYNYTSGGGRLQIWQTGLHIMLNNPLLGVGVSNFIVAEGTSNFSTGVAWSAAHNSFIQIGAELGIPGLMAFCLIIFKSIRQLRALRKAATVSGDPGSQFHVYASNSMIAAWMGFVVTGFFLSAAFTTVLITLVGLSAIITAVPKQAVQKIKTGKIPAVRPAKCS